MTKAAELAKMGEVLTNSVRLVGEGILLSMVQCKWHREVLVNWVRCIQ
jgi:hypothetical protein